MISETISNIPMFALYASQRRRERKDWGKISDEIIAENSLTWGRKQSYKSRKCRASQAG